MDWRIRRAVICACFQAFRSRRAWVEHRRGCSRFLAIRRLATGRHWHRRHDVSGWRERRAQYLREKALVASKPAPRKVG